MTVKKTPKRKPTPPASAAGRQAVGRASNRVNTPEQRRVNALRVGKQGQGAAAGRRRDVANQARQNSNEPFQILSNALTGATTRSTRTTPKTKKKK